MLWRGHINGKMSPFESLYGKKCNTLEIWDNPFDIVIIGSKMLKDMEG